MRFFVTDLRRCGPRNKPDPERSRSRAPAVNSELEAALGTVSAAEAAEAAQQQAQPAAPAPAAASVDALSSDTASSSPSEESGQTSETPLAANNTASGEAAARVQHAHGVFAADR